MKRKPLAITTTSGILSGAAVALLFIFFIPHITKTMWEKIFEYNWSLQWIPLYEGYLLYILFMLFVSALTIHHLRAEIPSLEIASALGIYYGIVSSLATTVLMMMNLQLTKGFIYLMFYLETALPLVCIAIIFGALGAGIQYWICTRDGDSKDSPGSQVLHSRILLGVLPVVFILVLFLVFISPDIVVSGIRSGDIDWNPCCERMDFIDKIDRTGTDSISISMKADQDKYPELAPRPVFFISVNGKDLSNMSSIRAQGLADTIDPLEGLLFADQSSVILKGPDVSNSSGPCYVNISEKFSKRAVRPLANYRV